MIRLSMSRGWSGEPFREHRTIEVMTTRYLVRLWLKPFCWGYRFSNYGPLCVGFAWFGCSIFSLRSEP